MERLERLEILGWEIDTLSSSFTEDAAYVIAAFRLSQAGVSFTPATGTFFEEDVQRISERPLEGEEVEFLEELHQAMEDEVCSIAECMTEMQEESIMGEIRISIPSLSSSVSERICLGFSEAAIYSYETGEIGGTGELSSSVVLRTTREADAVELRQAVTEYLYSVDEEAGRYFKEVSSLAS